jgi:hypothetical protein
MANQIEIHELRKAHNKSTMMAEKIEGIILENHSNYGTKYAFTTIFKHVICIYMHLYI